MSIVKSGLGLTLHLIPVRYWRHVPCQRDRYANCATCFGDSDAKEPMMQQAATEFDTALDEVAQAPKPKRYSDSSICHLLYYICIGI